VIYVPRTPAFCRQRSRSIPLQLLAYRMRVGCAALNVDAAPILAKTVTVK